VKSGNSFPDSLAVTAQVLTEEINQRPKPEIVKINQADNLGWTALHHAAAAGQMLAIRQLGKDKELDVNYKDIAGRTPLHAAAQHCHAQVAELLIKMKADVHAVDCNGRTPLHLAAAIHDKTMHAKLAKPKGEGNARYVTLKRQGTAFSSTDERGSGGQGLPAVKFTLPCTNNVTLVEVEQEYVKTRRKTGGLKLTQPTEHLKICKVLVRYGARPAHKDDEGARAKDLCASRDEKLLELLAAEDDAQDDA
jgi:ankyrin repeat protein